ncbi:MAG: hypothetical protein QM767_25080 [Anaeromyxobacter sp.]
MAGSTSWRFHRDGVVARRMGKTTVLRYSDVIAYAYQELEGGVRLPDVWAMTLHGRRGERVQVRVQPDLKRELELPALHARLLPTLVAQLRNLSPEGLEWGPLRLRREGLRLPDGRIVAYGPELGTRSATSAGGRGLEVLFRGQPVATLEPGTLNLHLGFELLRERVSGRAAQDVAPRATAEASAARTAKDVRERQLGWVLAVFFLVATVGEGALYVSTQRELRALGEAPRPMTVAEAAQLGEDLQWVELSEGLEVRCDQGLQKSSQGSVLDTSYLASDEAGARWFYVKLKGEASCEQASAPGLVGLAKRASSGLPDWLRKRGLAVEPGVQQLVELEVDGGPETVGRGLWIYGGGAGFFALLLGFSIYVIVSRRPRPAAGGRARA